MIILILAFLKTQMIPLKDCTVCAKTGIGINKYIDKYATTDSDFGQNVS